MSSVAPTERTSCLIVVPAYNEAATIGRVLADIARHGSARDVVVVDDGSTDDTGEIAVRAGARVLRMPFNLGIGGAVQAGFLYAREQGYQRVVQVDADGQHLPEEIDKLETAMDEDPSLDMVCGSRFLAEYGYLAPISRRTGIHVFAWLCSRIVGQRITDPTSGFRLCNARAAALFARDYPHDYPEVEAILTLHYNRLRIREVPVRMLQRGGGASSISSGKSAYYMVKVLLAVFVGLVRARPFVEAGDDAPVAAVERI